MKFVLILASICSLSYSDTTAAPSKTIDQHFIYNGTSKKQVDSARTIGQQAREKFLRDKGNNFSQDSRNQSIDEYKEACHQLGQKEAELVQQWVKTLSDKGSYPLLIAMGMQSFSAKFSMLPSQKLVDGLDLLCTKLELQLQCLYAFGETKRQVKNRVEQMRRGDGPLRIMVESACNAAPLYAVLSTCVKKNVPKWADQCSEHIGSYNRTRYAVGEKIANDHIAVVNKIAQVTEDPKGVKEDKIRQRVAGLLTSALTDITRQEGERCARLEKVLGCVTPLVKQDCGGEAEYVIKTKISVGYLYAHREEALRKLFLFSPVPDAPQCLAIDPDV